MSESIQVAEAPSEPKVWRFISGVTTADLEDMLNNMALQGYQVYRMDRSNTKVTSLGALGSTGSTLVVPEYDIVFFNPVLMGTNQAIGLQQALMKAGLNVGPTSTAGG